ncbi:CDP-alcohol phosphatidyltransferase family protein [Aurantimonas aggregata]|uniref:CDP-alcohol phosphatidyltransferase family protein n=1 Tax=Aurantimonas aggregata TaxID=2047720 RepID=A0A6L9MH99_9HYPH|nr:CDP-alcohol phosphatidyltransferase family protein [Aurantimonas aggregata]NDV87187.1 CDP-alcohol phosphatidyltransferase family protein [Aurantimonas aggregata]
MLDGVLKKRIDPPIAFLAAVLCRRGVGADAVTVAGLVLGLAAAFAIAVGQLWLGLALILVSRLADGLDGAVARLTRRTDRGGYLDIVFDYIFYGAIPLAFAILDPAANALAAAVLLASFYANGASFLAFAVMAEKRGLSTEQRGKKSLYFSTGLAEATETIATFVLFCLFPGHFAVIAYVFAAMTAWTCVSRIRLSLQLFR